MTSEEVSNSWDLSVETVKLSIQGHTGHLYEEGP